MSKVIFKFPLTGGSQQAVLIPQDGQILSLQTQNEMPCLWVLVDPDAPPEERIFNLYGTGHPFSPEPQEFIGTFQLGGGRLVFHVFELLTSK